MIDEADMLLHLVEPMAVPREELPPGVMEEVQPLEATEEPLEGLALCLQFSISSL
jgi:hypothetical protein